MTFYFLIDDVLRHLEGAATMEEGLSGLVAGADEAGYIAEASHLPHYIQDTPRFLNLNTEQGINLFAALLEEHPNFHINLENAVDKMLYARHENSRVRAALEKIFPVLTLPKSIMETERDPNEIIGSLHHPMVARLDARELAVLYCAFLREIEPYHGDFMLGKTVFGRNAQRLLSRFDGYIAGHYGEFSVKLLFEQGLHFNYHPDKTTQTYIDEGRNAALAMFVSEPHEVLWAFLETEEKQILHARRIDRALRLRALTAVTLPLWLRSEVLELVRLESMKKFFSKTLDAADVSQSANVLGDEPPQETWESILTYAPLLRDSINAYIAGQMNGNVKKLLDGLMHYTLSSTSYDGAGVSLIRDIRRHRDEARRVRLL